jgi:hypothetical protein
MKADAMDELIEELERLGYVIYRLMNDTQDEYIVAAKDGGRIVLNGCSLGDVQRLLQEEAAA